MEIYGSTSVKSRLADDQGSAIADLAMHLSTGETKGELLRNKRADVHVIRAHLADTVR